MKPFTIFSLVTSLLRWPRYVENKFNSTLLSVSITSLGVIQILARQVLLSNYFGWRESQCLCALNLALKGGNGLNGSQDMKRHFCSKYDIIFKLGNWSISWVNKTKFREKFDFQIIFNWWKKKIINVKLSYKIP